MQTWLPYPNYEASARVLDRQRLGKQRSEALALLRGKWPHHPAARMWRGYERSLALFALAICDEWIRRGYRDTVRSKVEALLADFPDTGQPPFLGDAAFHASHRSALVRKDPAHYRPYFPEVADDLPLVWPLPEGFLKGASAN